MRMGAFESAVIEFVRSLSEARRKELSELFINSHASWTWYAEVIERYGLRDSTNPIIVDLEARFPDDLIFRFMESDFDGPVFEAGLFLRESKKMVLEAIQQRQKED